MAWSINPAVGIISSAGLYTSPQTVSQNQIVTVTATSTIDPAETGTSTINLSTGAGVSYVGSDPKTFGSWQGIYGADGYSLAPAFQTLPSYASLTIANQLSHIWIQGTTDTRALQIPGGSGGIAAAWYNNSSFSFDVNFKDGNSHQLALYFLDWDSEARAETVQFLDASTNALLDVEEASSFENGTYLVWNVSGHVKIIVTSVVSPNAVVSGIFFGGSTGSTVGAGSESVTVSPATTNLTAGGMQQFSATIQNGTSQTLTWTIASVSPTGAAPGTFSATTSGLYLAPTNVSQTETVTVQATLSDGTLGKATVQLIPTTASTAVASYVKTDTSTNGNWQISYGADGDALANFSPQNIPGYTSFQLQNQQNWTWASTTNDPRALQIPSSSAGIAATWYNASSFSINFGIAGAHQLALYFVDWDGRGRSENNSDRRRKHQRSAQYTEYFQFHKWTLFGVGHHRKRQDQRDCHGWSECRP